MLILDMSPFRSISHGKQTVPIHSIYPLSSRSERTAVCVICEVVCVCMDGVNGWHLACDGWMDGSIVHTFASNRMVGTSKRESKGDIDGVLG